MFIATYNITYFNFKHRKYYINIIFEFKSLDFTKKIYCWPVKYFSLLVN